jgi:hypothetical protein
MMQKRFITQAHETHKKKVIHFPRRHATAHQFPPQAVTNPRQGDLLVKPSNLNHQKPRNSNF